MCSNIILSVVLISTIFLDFVEGMGKCVITECKEREKPPCARGFSLKYPMKYLCPTMFQNRYKCCPETFGPIVEEDEVIEGIGMDAEMEDPERDLPKVRVCTLTECKSTKTKDLKCKKGSLEYGMIEGKCGAGNAKYRCCHYTGLIGPHPHPPHHKDPALEVVGDGIDKFATSMELKESKMADAGSLFTEELQEQ